MKFAMKHLGFIILLILISYQGKIKNVIKWDFRKANNGRGTGERAYILINKRSTDNNLILLGVSNDKI